MLSLDFGLDLIMLYIRLSSVIHLSIEINVHVIKDSARQYSSGVLACSIMTAKLSEIFDRYTYIEIHHICSIILCRMYWQYTASE